MEVYYNDVLAASVEYISSEAVKAIVPALASTGKIKAITAVGQAGECRCIYGTRK